MADSESLRISVVFPSRGRAAIAHQSLQSLVDKASSNIGIEYVLAIDTDDKDSHSYFSNVMLPAFKKQKINCRIFVVEPVGYQNLHLYVNFLAEQSFGRWLIFWNDDLSMKSNDWDLEIEQYNGKFKLLKFRDNHNNHPIAPFPVIPRTWFELFGQIAPQAEYDSWLCHVCYAVDCVENLKCTVYHDRFDLTGNNNDATYNARSKPTNFWCNEFIAMRWQHMIALSQHMMKTGHDLTHWNWVYSNNKLNDIKELYKKFIENDPYGQVPILNSTLMSDSEAKKILNDIQQTKPTP